MQNRTAQETLEIIIMAQIYDTTMNCDSNICMYTEAGLSEKYGIWNNLRQCV
jgi:hypothetical protein